MNLFPASTKHSDMVLFKHFILKPGETIEIAEEKKKHLLKLKNNYNDASVIKV